MPVGDAHDDGDDVASLRRFSTAPDFEAIDLVGGAVFDVCVRYLREDPWERMRILSGWVKHTPLIVMTRGQSLFTFEFFPDDIVELTAERIFANGIRYHTPYDALNDMRNMEVPVRAAKKVGLYTAGGVVYTVSPVHTDDYYARKITELVALGVDAVYIKDPSGLLDARAGAHAGSGRSRPHAENCRCICIRIASPDLRPTSPAGPSSSVWMSSTPQPRRSPTVPRIRRPNSSSKTSGATASKSTSTLRPWKRSQNGCATLPSAKDKPVGSIVEYDAFHYEHQMPGGMVSNLKSQLATIGISERLPRGSRGGSARPLRARLPDHRQPLCAIRDDAGGAQRDGQGTLRDRSR